MSAIDSLRKYYKRGAERDATALLQELQTETDRAAVILITSAIEDALATAIYFALPGAETEKDYDGLFGPHRPLSTLSAKVVLAKALNVVDADTAARLDDLREMRNACAHSYRPISFKTKQLRAVALRLFSAEDTFARPADNSDAEQVRQSVIVEGLLIVMTLEAGSRSKALAQVRKAIRQMDQEAQA